jgi:hypothetical protein
MCKKDQLVVHESAVSMFGTTDPAAIAAAETAKARIGMAYMKAMQSPRNVEQSRVKILEACRRPEFAERVEFNKPVGGGNITGPSVRFAELCIREWGNVITETQIIYEDDRIRRSKVTCIDLENNATFTKEIQVSKTVERKYDKGREVISKRANSYGQPVYVVSATDDELQQKEAALISKAVRNEGLRLIDCDIVDEGIAIARQTLHARDAENPKAARRNITDNFKLIGVYPKDLDEYLGQSLESASPHQLQDLRGLYRSIRDNETTWAQVMAVEPDEAEAGTQSQTEQLKDKLAKAKVKQPVDSQAEAVEQETEDIPPVESPATAEPSEPDDWDLLSGDDLIEAVGKLAAKKPDTKKAFDAIVRKKAWAELRPFARNIS